MRLIECVPNFSEGQDEETIKAIEIAIRSVEGVHLLHQDSGYSANRTVYTFAGEPELVFEAAFRAVSVAAMRIDMRHQTGEHPRIGACDVCPFIPIAGISMEELVTMSIEFSKRVFIELAIPVFLYEESASSTARKNLASHRKGNYETLEKRMTEGSAIPDFGKDFNAKSGAMVCGVRPFLIAYNINLNTRDQNLAQEIAYDLRELGRPIIQSNGMKTFIPGKLKKVKAIGWYIPEFNMAQVSINIIDFKESPLHLVYQSCRELAKKRGLDLRGSELIGLIPLEALLEAGRFYLKESGLDEEQYLLKAIDELGLSSLEPFDYKSRILEYALMRF